MTAQPTPASIPGPHDIVRHRLSNGIVLLLRENHSSPAVVINGLIRAGNVDVLPEKSGLARFTASALMRGAGGRTFAQIFEELESVGASLSFGAGQHATEFSGQCLAEDVDLVLDIARDALFAPTFPAEQLEKLRGQIITSLRVQAHNTRYVASRTFHELAYPAEHPYSRSSAGTEQAIASITREEILAFYRPHFGSAGMILSIVGDMEAAEMLRRVEARLGDWPETLGRLRPQPELPAVPVLAAVRQQSTPVPGKTQSDIMLGQAGPPRAAEDYMHTRLANTVLGVFGLMGRLGNNVRDRQGLAYYAYSQLRGGLGPGPWFVSAGVNPANVDQAVSSIRDEIRRLQDELVPADELADNKGFLTGSLPIHLETNDGVADTILDMELYELGLDYLLRYSEMIAAITAEQVQAAARKYLNPDLFALAIAGPPEGDAGE